MDVAAGRRHHQTGHAAAGCVNRTGVRAAGDGALVLRGNAAARRRLLGQRAQLRVHDRAAVHQADDCAASAAGYLLFHRHVAHVVGGRALQNQRDVGLNPPGCDARAAGADLLLHGEHAAQLAGIIALGEHAQQHKAAHAVIQRLAHHEAVAQLHKRGVERGVAAGRAQALRLLLRRYADVDAQRAVIRGLFHLLVAHQVHGLEADDARHAVFAHEHAARGDHARIDAAHAVKAQQAVLRRKADDEADLVHMRADHRALFARLAGVAAGIQVADGVREHPAPAAQDALRLLAQRRADLVLAAGYAAQGGQFTQQHSVSSQPAGSPATVSHKSRACSPMIDRSHSSTVVCMYLSGRLISVQGMPSRATCTHQASVQV